MGHKLEQKSSLAHSLNEGKSAKELLHHPVRLIRHFPVTVQLYYMASLFCNTLQSYLLCRSCPVGLTHQSETSLICKSNSVDHVLALIPN